MKIRFTSWFHHQLDDSFIFIFQIFYIHSTFYTAPTTLYSCLKCLQCVNWLYRQKVTRIIHKLIKIHIFASKAGSLIFFLPNFWRHARPLLIDAKFMYIENTRRNNVINSAIRMVLPLKRGHFTLIYTTGARLILFFCRLFFYLLRWWRCHLFIFPSKKLLAYHQRRTIYRLYKAI